MKPLIILAVVLVAIIILLVGCSSLERKMLFFPSHDPGDNGLTRWTKDGKLIGYARIVESPRNVWLMLHGNGGQAAGRTYALPSFSPTDSVFFAEYPGYGTREGIPSAAAFNRAAEDAYAYLRATYPNTPVCVAGESIGTGPSSHLASLSQPPDKVVLIVPFDRLSLVARDHFPCFLITLLMKNDWDNTASLSRYKGPVDIFAAETDTVIPISHARALAAAVPHARLITISGGHNEWADPGKVQVRNP